MKAAISSVIFSPSADRDDSAIETDVQLADDAEEVGVLTKLMLNVRRQAQESGNGDFNVLWLLGIAYYRNLIWEGGRLRVVIVSRV